MTDAAVVTEAISQADEMIDQFLDNRYSVPFSTVPVHIKLLSQELAYLFLHQMHPQGLSGRDRSRWEDITDPGEGILARLGDGRQALPGVGIRSTAKSMTNTNDGRVPDIKWSHFDDNFNRIEADNERTPTDIW